MSLLSKCELLLHACEESIMRHSTMREQDRAPDFYKEVRPYIQSMDQLLTEWKEESLQWIAEGKPQHIHPIQINSVYDSMKQFLVQSFYKETGLKRFIESIRTTQYTLTTMKQALEKDADRN